jgi:hypothetical protein
MDSEFLRKKARALELLADSCFDGHTARRLRELADEFQTKAIATTSPKSRCLMSPGTGRAAAAAAVWTATRV